MHSHKPEALLAASSPRTPMLGVSAEAVAFDRAKSKPARMQGQLLA